MNQKKNLIYESSNCVFKRWKPNCVQTQMVYKVMSRFTSAFEDITLRLKYRFCVFISQLFGIKNKRQRTRQENMCMCLLKYHQTISVADLRILNISEELLLVTVSVLILL